MSKGHKPVCVLGTVLPPDGSACLLKDGRIHVAIEKERGTRRKHDGGNDTEAINYCPEAAGITYNVHTALVQNTNFGTLRGGKDWLLGQRVLSESVPFVTISHHQAHAYSAVGTFPFDEASVMVMDGCGNSFDDCVDLEGGHALDASEPACATTTTPGSSRTLPLRHPGRSGTQRGSRAQGRRRLSDQLHRRED